MKNAILAMLLTLAAALPASAQKVNLDFPELAAKAAETVDVTLDGSMLQLASAFLSDDADEKATKQLVSTLQGIYVRSYSFDKDGEYDMRLAERVRSQAGSAWKKIVNVQKRGEQVEIYVYPRGNAFGGMLIIAAEPREFTVVNIVGPITMDQLSKLEGQFGIPKVEKEGSK